MVAPLRLTYLLSISVRKNILWATIHLSSVQSPSLKTQKLPQDFCQPFQPIVCHSLPFQRNKNSARIQL